MGGDRAAGSGPCRAGRGLSGDSPAPATDTATPEGQCERPILTFTARMWQPRRGGCTSLLLSVRGLAPIDRSTATCSRLAVFHCCAVGTRGLRVLPRRPRDSHALLLVILRNKPITAKPIKRPSPLLGALNVRPAWVTRSFTQFSPCFLACGPSTSADIRLCEPCTLRPYHRCACSPLSLRGGPVKCPSGEDGLPPKSEISGGLS